MKMLITTGLLSLISLISPEQGSINVLHTYDPYLLKGERKATGEILERFDTNGNLYVAGNLGIQCCDQNGRVRAILTFPSGRISSFVFGGKERNILYALSEGKLFRRKMKVRGVESWMYLPQGLGIVSVFS